MANYWTIEDRDEFAVFASRNKADIEHYIDQHPELLGETKYLVCTYDNIRSIIPLTVTSLEQYIHDLKPQIQL
tara:strand:- start:130 stop:348 length:219 start_codon:yes stop_codon:yes gene_type:complete